MKELLNYLQSWSNGKCSAVPIDWSKAQPMVDDKDHVSKNDILATVEKTLDGTLIICNGAPAHILMAVPDLVKMDIAFVPHYLSSIGREGHSEKDVYTQLGRIKGVVEYHGRKDLESFLAQAKVQAPKAVAIGLFEIPPHGSGQNYTYAYERLRGTVDQEHFGIRKILFIGEDINVTNYQKCLDGNSPPTNQAQKFLIYCKNKGIEIHVDSFGKSKPQSGESQTFHPPKPIDGYLFCGNCENTPYEIGELERFSEKELGRTDFRIIGKAFDASGKLIEGYVAVFGR